jgi:hypothetical protein
MGRFYTPVLDPNSVLVNIANPYTVQRGNVTAQGTATNLYHSLAGPLTGHEQNYQVGPMAERAKDTISQVEAWTGRANSAADRVIQQTGARGRAMLIRATSALAAFRAGRL